MLSFAAALAVYLLAFAFLVIFQRELFYSRATHGSWQDLSAQAKEMGLEPWLDRKGAPLGFKKLSPHSKYRCVVFHGNALDALHRIAFVHGLEQFGGEWDVYLFEYPGYGWRDGKASQTNLVCDALFAWQQLQDADSGKPTFIFGESLGAAVACQLAEEIAKGDDRYVDANGAYAWRPYSLQIAGMFLITPFNHLGEAAQNHFKIFPVQPFMFDTYRSDEAIQHYHGPIAFMLAESDRIIPARIGRKLYDAYRGPKKLWVIPRAGHNTIPKAPKEPWWREVVEFLIEQQ